MHAYWKKMAPSRRQRPCLIRTSISPANAPWRCISGIVWRSSWSFSTLKEKVRKESYHINCSLWKKGFARIQNPRSHPVLLKMSIAPRYWGKKSSYAMKAAASLLTYVRFTFSNCISVISMNLVIFVSLPICLVISSKTWEAACFNGM